MWVAKTLAQERAGTGRNRQEQEGAEGAGRSARQPASLPGHLPRFTSSVFRILYSVQQAAKQHSNMDYLRKRGKEPFGIRPDPCLILVDGWRAEKQNTEKAEPTAGGLWSTNKSGHRHS